MAGVEGGGIDKMKIIRKLCSKKLLFFIVTVGETHFIMKITTYNIVKFAIYILKITN